jgi:membrane protein required for colicin V production
MNYVIDAIILLCLGWGAYKGFKKGFIIQSFVILALVLAIWGGFAFAGKLEPFMQKHFQMSELVCSIISFIIVFLLILILVYTSGHLVSKVADAVTLGMINRLAGAAFGIFANALILSVLILLFNRVNDKKHFIESEALEKTYLYKPIGKVAPAIFPEKFFNKLLN